MSENTEQTTKPKKQQQAQAVELPRGIPVKVLRLVNKGAQVAGYGSTDVVQSQMLSNGCSWTIEFIPQIRHHKITFTDPNRADRCKVSMVHESRVDSWEPEAL